MEKLLYIIITLVSGILLMIVHELVKNIVYYNIKKRDGAKVDKKIFYLWKYIDLVGLITTLAMYTPFSKQYRYTISNKKTAFWVGFTGLLSLIIIFLICIITLRCNFEDYISATKLIDTHSIRYYSYLVLVNLSMLSMSMLLVNIFPITCFDMGLLILGTNSKNRGSIVIFDGYLKLLFFFMTVLRVFLNASTIISNYAISLFI